jgi:type I restriction enzyme S subunit
MEVRESSAKYLVRPRYKQTEVGVIPEDWTVVPFAELMKFRNGINADKRAYGRGVPFINVLEVITKGHLRASDIPGRVSIGKSVASLFAVCQGDLVFNRSSETLEEVGLSAVYLDDVPAVFGGFVIRGQLKGNIVDPAYSGYAFRAPAIRTQIVAKGQGAIRANIGQSELKLINAPLPPLPEQEAIAEALSDADALIESLAQLIAKKRQLKQGAMQELLTGKNRLPGFSGEWAVKRLGDVLTIRHGKSQKEVESIDGAYPVLATGGQIGRASQFLSDRPSVLIGRKGTIDQPQYMDTPFWTVDTLFYSDVHPKNNAKFLFYRFCLIDWKQYNEASGVPSLNARTIESVEILCPEPAEQTAIATLLGDMDMELAELESRLAKARQLKQGMMQELLTGRIRLL